MPLCTVNVCADVFADALTILRSFWHSQRLRWDGVEPLQGKQTNSWHQPGRAVQSCNKARCTPTAMAIPRKDLMPNRGSADEPPKLQPGINKNRSVIEERLGPAKAILRGRTMAEGVLPEHPLPTPPWRTCHPLHHPPRRGHTTPLRRRGVTWRGEPRLRRFFLKNLNLTAERCARRRRPCRARTTSSSR